jgi:transposase-like protein
MLSSLEKSTDLQKATQSFIKAVKRVANKLPVNRAQIEGDLSLFVSGLWDKLESEITSDFTGESRLIETSGTSRRVLIDPQCKLNCPHCQSNRIVKRGFTASGKQRYLCRSCKRESRENPDRYSYDVNKREQVMRVYLIFKSYRKVAQVCGVDRRTVASWIKQNGVTIFHPRPPKATKRNNSSA